MLKKGVLILIIAIVGAGYAYASDSDAPSDAAGASAAPSTPVTLVVGRSAVIDVGVPITRVSLTSAEIADALVTSSSQLLVHGKQPGSISMFVWNRAGAIQRYEVAVQRDLAKLKDQVLQLFPGEHIDVRGNGRFVVLSGMLSGASIRWIRPTSKINTTPASIHGLDALVCISAPLIFACMEYRKIA